MTEHGAAVVSSVPYSELWKYGFVVMNALIFCVQMKTKMAILPFGAGGDVAGTICGAADLRCFIYV